MSDVYKKSISTEIELIDNTANAATSVQRNLAAIGKEANKLEGAGSGLASIGTSMNKLGSSMAKTGAKMTLGLTTPLVKLGKKAIEEAMDYETAFMGVRKVVNDLSTAELDALAVSFRELSTEIPVTASALAEIAAVGAQSGIAGKDLEEYAELIARLSYSVEGLAPEDAALRIAKIANVINMSNTDIGRFASTLVELGNNTASTEAQILAIASEIAASTAQHGFSPSDILALSAAVADLGIQPQKARSAFSSLFQGISEAVHESGDDLEKYALIADMTAEEFATAWRTDPAEAVSDLFEGFGRESAAGTPVFEHLKELGEGGLLVKDVVTSLANAKNPLSHYLEMAEKEWEENNALVEESDAAFDTFANRFQVVGNKFSAALEKVGLAMLPTLEDLADTVGDVSDAFAELDPDAIDAITRAAVALAATGPALGLLGKAVRGVGSIFSLIGEVAKAGGIAAIAKRHPIIAALTGGGLAVKGVQWAYNKWQENLGKKGKNESVEDWLPSFTQYHVGERGANLAQHAAEQMAYYEETDKQLSQLNEWSMHQEKRTGAGVRIDPLAAKHMESTIDAIVDMFPALNEWLTIDPDTGGLVQTMGAIREEFEAINRNNAMLALQETIAQYETNLNNLLAVQQELVAAGVTTADPEQGSDLKIINDQITQHEEALTALQEAYDKLVTPPEEGVMGPPTPGDLEESTAAVEAYQAVLDSLPPTVTATMEGANQELAAGGDRAISTAGYTTDGVVTTFQSAIAPTRAHGRAVAIGFAEGILSGDAAVQQAANAIAYTAPYSIGNTLQVQSPSRVTRQLGEHTGEGFALGIEGQAAATERAARVLAARAAVGMMAARRTYTEGMFDAPDDFEQDSPRLDVLRKLATRQAVNRYTTAEIKVEQNNNNSISSDMDIDGVTRRLVQGLQEAVAVSTEGAY